MILCGLGIEDRHAHIFHKDGRYFLEPLSEAASEYVYVNGKTIGIGQPFQIFHNDRVIFGTNSVFMFKT